MSSQIAPEAVEQRRGDTRPLSIFTRALSARILRAHAGGPLSCGELEEKMGWAPESSLRAAVSDLCDISALVAHLPADGCQREATELTPAGRELLPVAQALERWLWSAPQGPISLEDDAARGIVRILLAGWDSAVLRTVAERPFSLAALNARISASSESTLRRRLGKLRSTGLMVRIGDRRTAPYTTTDWLRQAVVPLALAGRWQLRYGAEPAPISRGEAETALLLALPLVELSPRASGTCAFAVLTPDYRVSRGEIAGIGVEIERGRITGCQATVTSDPANWVLGTAEAWLDAAIDGDVGSLRVGGAEPQLALHVVNRMRETLRCPI